MKRLLLALVGASVALGVGFALALRVPAAEPADGKAALEELIVPSLFDQSGALGNLMPAQEVAFNTDTGQYQVDNGPWLAGGRAETNNGSSLMVYNFATISLGPGVAFSASGSNALALIGAGN